MNSKRTVIMFAGLFLLAWVLCAGMLRAENVRFSSGGRMAWTLRVVNIVDHIVKKGESLNKIARKYGVSLQVLLKENNITDPDAIKAGEKIKIPMNKVKGEVLI